jgi:hypothetical protein
VPRSLPHPRIPRRARLISHPLVVVVLTWGLAASADEDGAAPDSSMRIAADVDWAYMPDDGLRITDFERFHGIDPETLADIEVEQDGMLFGRDSNAASVMAHQGLPPLPAVQYEASPGVLYVAMGGVTLRPGQNANAALNRSPLVSAETNFPAYGSESQQSALLQSLQSYYADFDLMVYPNRPPEYLPYTMAVVGGSAQTAGFPGGVCGVANVSCDGLQRNHVSLTFPQSCSGVAATAAQETAHNWGLEHTSNQADIMYPYSTGGSKSFVNSCMTISHATGDGVTQCGHIHREYCNGNSEQQNSYTELMAAFGPRTPDNSPPQIIELFPEDGATMTTEDSFTVSARVTENSNFLGAKWTWLEGLPDGMDTWTRCTNSVCDDNYGLGVDFDPDEIPWDLVRLTTPPEGTYKFRFEVMDAYGNADARDLTVHVVPPGEGGGSGSGGGDGSGGDGSGSGGDSGGDGGESDSDGSDSAGGDGGDGDGGSKGRGCTVASRSRHAGGAGILAVLALASVRRRRR